MKILNLSGQVARHLLALLVKKKNGSARNSFAYRELNKNTVSDKFPLPLILDEIARLRAAKYFTSLDMA